MKIAEAIFKIKELRIMRAKKSNLKERLVGEIIETPVKKKNYRLIEVLYRLFDQYIGIRGSLQRRRRK